MRIEIRCIATDALGNFCWTGAEKYRISHRWLPESSIAFTNFVSKKFSRWKFATVNYLKMIKRYQRTLELSRAFDFKIMISTLSMFNDVDKFHPKHRKPECQFHVCGTWISRCTVSIWSMGDWHSISTFILFDIFVAYKMHTIAQSNIFRINFPTHSFC